MPEGQSGPEVARLSQQRCLSLCTPLDCSWSPAATRVFPQFLLVWPGPEYRMGLSLRGPVATRTDTAPLVWVHDAS
ncbi:Hypothetical predicted protein [Marmota monax]|uniref:Uncharacterized protein n=1 Tax=Marmota monax TaxID=9995 RepID=A0A5E4CWD5_MARMO|nr:Hypothetical predicted protein [Marmota monax]